MAANVHLTPELEHFLQEAESRRRQFHSMLQQAEADNDGAVLLDDVLAEVDAVIASSQQ